MTHQSAPHAGHHYGAAQAWQAHCALLLFGGRLATYTWPRT